MHSKKKLDMFQPHAIYGRKVDPPEFKMGWGYKLPVAGRKRHEARKFIDGC